MSTNIRILPALFLLLTISPKAVAPLQQKQDLLTYGITGSEKTDGTRPGFSSVMSRIEVQKLLLDIANSPRTPEFIDSVLQASGVSREDLEKLGLIRQQSDHYVLSFTLLTSADVRKVREVAETSARSLVAAFLARRKEIDASLNKYQVKEGDPKAVAYIVFGCFSLDWDGGDLAARKGYRTMPPKEGYIPWAEQKSELSLKGVYWGSHNEYLPDVVFTSFGDHFSLPRYAFPDLFWKLRQRLTQTEMPEGLKSKLVPAAQQSLSGMMRNAGRLMFTLREGEKSLDEMTKTSGIKPEDTAALVAVLEELGYVAQEKGRYRVLIPVFTQRDLPMLEELRRMGERIIDTWITTNYDQLKMMLSDITPIRFGVPFAHAFTQIWHYVFGIANRQLVEAGLFGNPYADARKYKGFIPVVWHPDVWRFR